MSDGTERGTAAAENCLPIRAGEAVQAERGQNRTLTRATAGGNSSAGNLPLDLPPIGRELTRCERALLRVLLDPTHFTTTTAQRAAAAGISLRSYGSIMRRGDFQSLVSHAYRTALSEHVGAVLQAAIATASTPGRNGYQDRAMVLQMAGIHLPKQQLDVRPAGPMVAIVGVSPGEI